MHAFALALLLAVPQTGFAFGRDGGTVRPFRVTIATTGVVTAVGAAPMHRTLLTKEQLANLNRVAYVTSFALLPATTDCAGTLPDVAVQSIRVGAHVVRVHGACVARFNRLWTTLQRSIRR